MTVLFIAFKDKLSKSKTVLCFCYIKNMVKKITQQKPFGWQYMYSLHGVLTSLSLAFSNSFCLEADTSPCFSSWTLVCHSEQNIIQSNHVKTQNLRFPKSNNNINQQNSTKIFRFSFLCEIFQSYVSFTWIWFSSLIHCNRFSFVFSTWSCNHAHTCRLLLTL